MVEENFEIWGFDMAQNRGFQTSFRYERFAMVEELKKIDLRM